LSPRPRKNDGEDQGEGPVEGTLAPSAELEEALRKATEALDDSGAPESAEKEVSPTGKSTADKVTIEALSLELETVRRSAEEKTAALAEVEDRALRLQAEFENFRKRGIRDREEAQRFGHQNLVKDLLATVDNLERAIEHGEGGDERSLDGIVQGVELVHRELLAALAKYGVSAIEALREPFDPNLHEAVGQNPSDECSPNTVVEVLEKGYRIHDRMVRPARVIISVASGEAAGEEES
jgi:molecular chaperone GrpE